MASQVRKSGMMLGAGVGYHYDFSEKLFLESSFLPGVYIKNNDVNLVNSHSLELNWVSDTSFQRK